MSAMSRYKQLNKEERFTIESMIRNGYSASSIARTLSRSRSTITRDIKRNSGRQCYIFLRHSAKAKLSYG
ncbi:MAG: helix-turn-helix domain-containing protein [Elusimicrobiales bacterium]|nr:helix-turn-helix domain-containing protein [Elusimicrobiales bacterium]